MKKTILGVTCFLAIMGILAGCGERYSGIGGSAGDATDVTLKANEQVADSLRLDDPQDFEDARCGLIARPNGKIIGSDGSVIVDVDAFTFLEGYPPQTVNPSLWRHAVLNTQIGLFKVADGIYQIRGFDISNMTLIDGRTGWIVVDTLTCQESAEAAIGFARKHLGNKQVSAIIFTHTHVDHFGGSLGVVSPLEASERKIPVIAPEGFMEEAVSENVLVGPAMGRRATYQFGLELALSPKGNVDEGLGKVAVKGRYGILPPSIVITQAEQEVTVDGVRFIFYNVPGAEAPAELTFLIPDMKAYCGAELLTRTMHNLLPMRGAKVRDGLQWSTYLDHALKHAAGAEVCFNTHNYPVWGKERIAEFITKHRDVYKYTHDQTVRLINAGYTPREIAEMVKLPASLESYLPGRGYYGDLRHNVKAVYQFYMGFYDGNPANLNPLPPEESAKRYVELAGGADKAVAAARASFDKGEYRWTAELLNHVVFADPGNRDAIELLACTYDQMGYMAESATCRNSYLTAAAELRNGPPKKSNDRSAIIDILVQTPIERLLDAMAAALNGPEAESKKLKVNLVLSESGESHVLWIENSVLHHKKAPPEADANATLNVTKEMFVRMMAGTAGLKEKLLSPDLKVSGSAIDLIRFFSLFDKVSRAFAVVTP